MNPEQVSKLADLLQNRYTSDFSSKISVFSEHSSELGMLMWRRYLKQHGIKLLYDSLPNSHHQEAEEGDITVQIRWYQGINTVLAVPKELALKCLVLGGFPPVESNSWERTIEFSAN